MSKTTYPPKARIMKPSITEICDALRQVRKHKVDWWNPWENEISDNCIRWLRKNKYVDSYTASGAIQMAQNNFGHTWIEDEINNKGINWLKSRRY